MIDDPLEQVPISSANPNRKFQLGTTISKEIEFLLFMFQKKPETL